MKIALSNIAWEHSENDAIAKILQAYDIHGLEIAPTKIWKDPTRVTKNDISSYKKYWNKKNIEIIAMQSLLYSQSTIFVLPN